MIHRQDGFTVFKVAAQDLEKDRLRILSNTSLDESPTVAPNGSMVIYATRQSGKGVLMLASLNEYASSCQVLREKFVNPHGLPF